MTKLKFGTILVPLLLLLITTTIVSAYSASYGNQNYFSGRSQPSANINYIRATLPKLSTEQSPSSVNLNIDNSGESIQFKDSSIPSSNDEREPAKLLLNSTSAENVAECSNDSVRKDFGTACLKKAISGSVPTDSQEDSAQEVPANPVTLFNYNTRNGPKVSQPPRRRPASSGQSRRPGNPNKSTRHFSVKPMMISSSKKRVSTQQQHQYQNQGAFKSPASNARQLYASKGYNQYSQSSYHNNNGYYPNSPGNFYQDNRKSGWGQNSVNQIDKQEQTKDEEEWNGMDDNSGYQPENPSGSEPIVPQPPPQPPQQPAPPTGEYEDEMEMLVSLKRSLGIISAQTANLKQRTLLMYREARRRKLYFFDALLGRTYNFISEKQEETRNALTDIDAAIDQIQNHHQLGTLPTNLRRLRYRREAPLAALFSGIRGRRTPRRNRRAGSARTKKNLANHLISGRSASASPDRKEIERLIEDAVNHAKRMMEIIRELNEALDEFEEQFNLPRFEPNDIELGNNSVDSKEDF